MVSMGVIDLLNGCLGFFTTRKRSLRRLCFYTCLSVILFTEGVCLSACWDTTPPPHKSRHPREQTPPQEQTHPQEQAHPPGSRHPPGADTSPRSRHPPRRGRYASYWNAILFQIYLKSSPKCYLNNSSK